MPKESKGPVFSALKAYEQDPAQNVKKAVLLTPQGGYFLYGNRFCELAEYELEFFSESSQIQGKTVPKPMFFSILPDGFRAVGELMDTPTLVSLIFRINLGEDEPLRGILLALGQEAQLSLFSDASVEALYRLARRSHTCPNRASPPDEEMRQYAEVLRRKELHGLTSLYLQGKQLKHLIAKEKSTSD